MTILNPRNFTLDQSSSLKALAMCSMLIDHIGVFLFPHILWFRFIGRLALPLFCFQLTVGYFHTRNLFGYIKRMAVFAIISQLPYYFLRVHRLNIFFSFLFYLIILWSVDQIIKSYQDNKIIRATLVMVSFLAAAIFISFSDYGFYGLSLVLLFRYVGNISILITGLTLSTLAYSVYYRAGYQMLAALSPLLIHNPIKMFRLPPWLFYWFYPTHLTIILVIKTLWQI